MLTMFKGNRTFIIAALQAVFGTLAVVDWNPVLSDPKAGWMAIAGSVLMAFMRSITTTPPSEKA